MSTSITKKSPKWGYLDWLFPLFQLLAWVVSMISLSDLVSMPPSAPSLFSPLPPARPRDFRPLAATSTGSGTARPVAEAAAAEAAAAAAAATTGGPASSSGGAALCRPPRYCTFWDSAQRTAGDIQGGDEVLDGSLAPYLLHQLSPKHGGRCNSSKFMGCLKAAIQPTCTTSLSCGYFSGSSGWRKKRMAEAWNDRLLVNSTREWSRDRNINVLGNIWFAEIPFEDHLRVRVRWSQLLGRKCLIRFLLHGWNLFHLTSWVCAAEFALCNFRSLFCLVVAIYLADYFSRQWLHQIKQKFDGNWQCIFGRWCFPVVSKTKDLTE